MTNTAQTIMNWLGNGRFLAMTGSRDFVDLHRGLQFKFHRTNGVNCCRITVDESDLYTVEFWLVTPTDSRLILSRESIYGAQLQSVFTSVTGIDTHL